MRKTTVLLTMLMIWLGCNLSYAQDSGYAGTISVEFNGNLFVQDDVLVTPTFLKARYFVTDEIAVRLSTWFDLSSDQMKPETSLNHSYFAIRPGAEYHLASQPGVFTAYVGLEAIVDFADFNKDTNVGVPVTGAWDVNNISNFNNRSYLSTGAVVFGGAEIYRGGSFFIGTELGLAFNYTMHSQVELGNDLFLDQSKSTAFGIDLSRVVRIGVLLNQGSSSRM